MIFLNESDIFSWFLAMKITENNGKSTEKHTLYTTVTPCVRVVFDTYQKHVDNFLIRINT